MKRADQNIDGGGQSSQILASATYASAIYEGEIRHRRFGPKENFFTYPIFLTYLDLAELPKLFQRRWLWSLEGRNVMSFRRHDYFGDPQVSLDQTVRDLVEERSGVRPQGPIRLLTHLRTLGHVMNPASFYYCFDPEGVRLEHVVVEINNTPWDERYCYVLSESHLRGKAGEIHQVRQRKVFHVSPFMELGHDYLWKYSSPGEKLLMHVENHDDGARIFDATLTLRRRPWTASNLARVLAKYPAMTAKVTWRIYYQALILWLKRIPFIPHPYVRDPSLGKERSERTGTEPLGGWQHE